MSDFILPALGTSELADLIRSAVGAGPFEEVVVRTPQFTRIDGNDPWWTPQRAADFDALKTAPDDFLRSLGLGIWDEEDGKQHWLYPGEWFNAIPEGYPLVCIDGKTYAHNRDETDDDIRFGCLAYGFVRAPQGKEGEK